VAWVQSFIAGRLGRDCRNCQTFAASPAKPGGLLCPASIAVKNLKASGWHHDGGGLYLKITDTGSKSWVFRFKRGKRENGSARVYNMGLGAYGERKPGVTLAAARDKAAEARAMLAKGINPLEEKAEAGVTKKYARAVVPDHLVTFNEAAERFIASREGGWKNEKHRQQWRNTLVEYAGPVIGKLDVAKVGTDDVLRILEPIWQTKAETASRVLGRIENVLDWAKVRGLRDGENPARWRGHLAHLLPTRNKARTVRHHPAMSWQDLPEFMGELRGNSSISATALRFTILTAVRTSEALEAKWPEIDLGNVAVRTVPKERMKASREHRVPLPPEAVAILEALPRLNGSDYLFPGARPGRPLSNMAMLELIRGMRPGLTVHGFRSTFRDWIAETTSFPRELAEAALAHIIGNTVERAYQRGDMFEKRRRLMEAWAEFCERGCTAPEGCLSKDSDRDLYGIAR